MKLIIALWLCFSVLPNGARSDTSSPAKYQVRKGDNLSVIAQRFGTTVKMIKSGNHLASDVIHVDQVLTLSRPFQGMSKSKVKWGYPVRRPGPVLRPFGPYKAGGILMPRTGVELACPTATQVRSPAIGIVRHSGPMEGFGHLLIIEHPGRYATVIAPLDPASLKVTIGQAVLRGDMLGRTAAPTETGAKPYIHLELRRDDKAIPPDRLIK